MRWLILAGLLASAAAAQEAEKPQAAPTMPKRMVIELTGPEAVSMMAAIDFMLRSKGVVFIRQADALVEKIEFARAKALNDEKLAVPPVNAPMPSSSQPQPVLAPLVNAPMPPDHSSK